MEQNKYVTIHSFLRMGAALIALVVFVSMFIAKQIVNTNFDEAFLTWNEAFFGDGVFKPVFMGFIGYILVILGGLAGLAFVFIDEIIGKDLTKKLAFVAGGVALVGAILIFLFEPIFSAINDRSDLVTAAGPIVFGIFGVLVGGINIAAPILEDKGL